MDITTMEPLVPVEAVGELDDAALALVADANRLAGRVHPLVQQAVGDLVRLMNCYYSNLIEGHDTHSRSIDRALANDFSNEPKQRDLQLEAVSHIHVQKLIDEELSHPEQGDGPSDDARCAHRAQSLWAQDRPILRCS